MTLNVLCLTAYTRVGASSRLRHYQFERELARRGIACEFRPLFNDDYLALRYRAPMRGRLLGVARMVRRVRDMLDAARFDLVWLQREALPFMPPWLEQRLGRVGVPYVVDYDDAVFHRYDAHAIGLVRRVLGDKIDRVMAGAACVVAGNAYLAARAERAGAKKVVHVPTVVPLEKYTPRQASPADGPLKVGWIGTPVTARFLETIAVPLRSVAERHPLQLVTVGAGPVTVPGVEVRGIEWSEASEAAAVAEFDVGVMPLVDAPFERGKCGYKLIQYMASGVPAIASPVGVNTTIVDHGENGWLASDDAEWALSLQSAAENREVLHAMGRAGRDKVARLYSIDAVIETLAGALETAAGERRAKKVGR